MARPLSLSESKSNAPSLFYSYSHKDEDMRDAFDLHLSLLKREGLISAWHDRRLGSCDSWKNGIDANLNTADIILLLLSPDYLKSPYCKDIELKRAMERHKNREAVVIPILLKPCAWTTESFAKLQISPKNGRPISEWPDAGFAAVAEELRMLIQEHLFLHDGASEPPFEAYSGNEPYLFASYSHKDKQLVYPEIERLHSLGFRIWYDEGIDPGNEWPDEVAKALDQSAYFVVFISPRSVESKNVRNEINFAINHAKPFVAIHVEETNLPKGLELRMGDIQAILKYRMKADRYHRQVDKTLPATLRAEKADHQAFWQLQFRCPSGGKSPTDEQLVRRLRDLASEAGIVSRGRTMEQSVKGNFKSSATTLLLDGPPSAFAKLEELQRAGRLSAALDLEVISLQLVLGMIINLPGQYLRQSAAGFLDSVLLRKDGQNR